MARNIKGGKKLNAFIRKAKNAKSVKEIQVGFFSSAKYPDGTPVAAVAAWNEFGTKRIKERPFFRNAISEGAEDELKPVTGQEHQPSHDGPGSDHRWQARPGNARPHPTQHHHAARGPRERS